jgi:two-component system, chemotaxis family, response regulator WspR
MSTTHPELLAVLDSASRLLGRRLELAVGCGEDERTVASPSAAIRSDSPMSAEHRSFLRDLLEVVEKHMLLAKSMAALEERVGSLERENAGLLMKNLALTQCSSRDALTGLFSRSFAAEKLEEEMNRAWRYGEAMSLLMIDIDHMQAINDRHGAEGGDEVLKEVGQIIRSTCRISDVPARYTGERFCVLLPSTPVARTRAVAERIRNRIHQHRFLLREEEVPVSCSIGVAGLDNVPDTAVFNPDSLIDRAGRALHVAKHKGRNRVETWSPRAAAEL